MGDRVRLATRGYGAFGLKVLVTGAKGFVGRWLTRELVAHGHEVVAAPPSRSFDITDPDHVTAYVRDIAPSVVVHLAAISFAGDARRDPVHAFRVNVGGTVNVMEAASALQRPPIVLVTGSSEAYGSPNPNDLPLREDSPLHASSPYGLSKLAQEGVAVELAHAHDLRLIVTRSFNHIGPGQRGDFVVPALAGRIADVLEGRASSIGVGNADVRRDFLDVRDVVRAYRLLIEAVDDDALPERVIVNVAAGRSVSIRWIAEELKRHAGCTARLEVDPELVRAADPADIVGDPSLLRDKTGWTPELKLEQTLAEVFDEQVAARGRPR